MKREKAAKPAFGARVDFRDLPDPPPPSRAEKGRGAEQGLLPGVLPEGTEEVEAWLKHDPGLESRLLEEAEKTFDPAVHDSIMGHYVALAKRRFRERTGTEIEGEPLKRGSG